MGPDMPQYLDENGNPIAAPAKVYLDDNGEPIKQTVTPASAEPMLPNGELRASPTFGENVASFFRHPLNSMEAASQRRSRPSDASIPEMAATDLYNFGAGATSVARHPIRTVGGILSQGLGARPVVEGLANYVSQQLGGKRLYDPAPIIPSSPEDAAYAGGQMFATAGLAKAGELGVGNLADAVHTPKGTSTTIPRVLRPLVEKTREAQKAATESADEYANAIKQKTGEIAADQSEKSKAAKAKGIEQERTHQKSVEETKAANKAAIREQEKIAPTKEKLQKSVQEMQAQIETARNNALKEGNKKYSAVNAALNHISADQEFMQGALADSLEAIKGTSTEPTIFKDMMRKGERDEVATYEDLQGYYSELGTELSKGNVPGDLYHAYDTIHEAIGDEMQRIADANGQGPQLKAARDYWRRMKQAFGKQYNPTDTGNAVLRNTAGDVMRRSQEANQLRLLGSFDKTIPQTAEHIENLQKGIDALPKEQPLRSILKPLPEKPAPVPPPKFEGTPEELAKQQTKLPKPVGKTVIDRADIEATKAENLQNTADWIGTKGLAFAIWPAVSVLRSFVRGAMPDLGAAGAEAGATIAAARVISRTLEHPTVVKFLTQATDKDIASIPPELRGDLPAIIRQAQKKGMTVSPALIAAAAGSAPKKTSGDLLRQAQ